MPPSRRKRKPGPKDCPYQVPWYGRARWIADRYYLPYEDVEHELWDIVGSGTDGCTTVIEDYMLVEQPDCNVGCSLCLRRRNAERTKIGETIPSVRKVSPIQFVRGAEKSNDPKVRAAIQHILDVQDLRDLEPPPDKYAYIAQRARCSFCGRSHVSAGPLMAWKAPEKVVSTRYLCRRCAETAIVVIDSLSDIQSEAEETLTAPD